MEENVIVASQKHIIIRLQYTSFKPVKMISLLTIQSDQDNFIIPINIRVTDISDLNFIDNMLNIGLLHQD